MTDIHHAEPALTEVSRSSSDDYKEVNDEKHVHIQADADEKHAHPTRMSRDSGRARQSLSQTVAASQLDPNFDPSLRHKAEHALEGGEAEAVAVEGMLEEDSPYAEVRAAVSNVDDPDMPVNTFRMWFIGLFFTVFLSGLNQFFYFRYPSVTITGLVAQLLAFPMGRAMARLLPSRTIRVFGREFGLNPGPFNIKEHTLITVMANVVYQRAYATDIVAAQRFFYNQNWSNGYAILLVLTTQCIGFSFAGICRRYLVWPAAMIWPQNLVYCALLNTLHSTRGNEDGGMTRERFFTYALVGSTVWYFFPGYIFTALSVFSWVTWFAPRNQKVNALFGYQSGLGMGFLTFDWAQISYISSPLVSPWWAEANVFASLLFFFWFLTPILHYSNVWESAYLPIISSRSYDRFGKRYNVSRVTNPDASLNEEAYFAYSPLYLPTSFALSYGLSFASITATLMHTFLFYRHDIVRQFRSSLKESPDIHARLMSAYKEVPDWWYAVIGLVSLALGITCIEVWPTQMPVWALFLSLVIAGVYVVPIGIIQAITNQQVGLNVITEFIIGYAVPGKPVCMMIFKTFGYISMAQALSFTQDLKLGHYMKIPPRLMFNAQVIATVLSAFILVGVQSWSFNNVEGICTPDQKDSFICPGITVFSTASVIWGLIGPARMFSTHAIFGKLLWFFLVGALLPIPFYFLATKYPERWFKYVNIPVFLTGTGNLPPATGINYSSWAMVGFLFQYVIRRHNFRWWSKYNYVLSAALDSGTGIATILIFFILYYPKHKVAGETVSGFELDWWGNNVYTKTCDADGCRHLQAPETGFGANTWL